MQTTLIENETELQRLSRIRKEKYKSLITQIDELNYRKKTIIENFNKEVKEIDKDILKKLRLNRLKK